MRTEALLGVAAASVLSGVAAADSAPRSPADPTWAIRSVVGYSKTGGNTDNSAGNLLFHVAHVMGDWKLLFGVDGLYGSTEGETTAQAWNAYLQANYYITPHFYWYVGGRYDDDRFSGFAYQAAVKSGVGYKFIDTDATKLTAQIGAGYRRLRPEILVKDDIGAVISRTEQPEESDAIVDAGLALEHNFNQYTKLLAAATVQSGQRNTLTNANVALQVKMTDRLALAAGYKLIDNSVRRQARGGATPSRHSAWSTSSRTRSCRRSRSSAQPRRNNRALLRCQSRSFSTARLSCCFLPLASPSCNLARPFFQ